MLEEHVEACPPPREWVNDLTIYADRELPVRVHPDFRELQSLVDEELEPIYRDDMKRHLRECEGCRDVASVLRNVAESLASIGSADAPSELPERILAACAEAEPVPRVGCDTARALASEYLDDELSGVQRDALETHLFSCESCYRAFKQMERTAEILRTTPPAAPPEDLHERICAAMEREKAPAPALFAWRKAIGIAAGMAAAAAILLAVMMPRMHDDTHEPAPESVAVQMEQPTEATTEPPPEQTIASTEDATVDQEHAEASAPPDTDRASPPQRAPAARPRPAQPPTRPAEPEIVVAPSESPHPDAESQPEEQTDEPTPALAHAPARPPAAHKPAEQDTPEAPETDTTPASPRDSEVAYLPQPGPVTEPALPGIDPEPQSTVEEPVERPESEIAVVPVQSESRTLYQASDEPPMDRIARAAAAVNTGVGRGWGDADTGIELR